MTNTIFPAKKTPTLKLQVEFFRDIHDEVVALGQQQFEEVEKRYRRHDCKPDLPTYFAHEQAGSFILFTARDSESNTLLGHMTFWLLTSMHMKGVLEATEDFLYVVPDSRGKGIFSSLYKYAEDSLRSLGVKYIGMSSKAPVGAPDSGSLLEKHGFQRVAVYYSKQLTRSEG